MNSIDVALQAIRRDEAALVNATSSSKIPVSFEAVRNADGSFRLAPRFA